MGSIMTYLSKTRKSIRRKNSNRKGTVTRSRRSRP